MTVPNSLNRHELACATTVVGVSTYLYNISILGDSGGPMTVPNSLNRHELDGATSRGFYLSI